MRWTTLNDRWKRERLYGKGEGLETRRGQRGVLEHTIWFTTRATARDQNTGKIGRIKYKNHIGRLPSTPSTRETKNPKNRREPARASPGGVFCPWAELLGRPKKLIRQGRTRKESIYLLRLRSWPSRSRAATQALARHVRVGSHDILEENGRVTGDGGQEELNSVRARIKAKGGLTNMKRPGAGVRTPARTHWSDAESRRLTCGC